MTEPLILKPEEVARRRSQTLEKKNLEADMEKEDEFQNTAGFVKIDYESQGRFATPPTLYFDDFNGKHINDIELSTQDNLLENLVVILNDLKRNEPDFNIKDMTAEDILETLIAIKQQYEGNTHIHYWICQCQSEKSDKDRVVNEYIIELSDLTFKSMDQVDEEMRAYMASRFAEMSDDEFKQFLIRKYKNNPLDDIDLHTREMEVSTIKVKEPFTILADGALYTIRYPRLEDVLKAKKFSDKLYGSKIKNIQNRREANVPLHELKQKKEDEINALKEAQGKDLVLYAKSMMLITKNNVVLSDDQKYEEFKNGIKRKTMRNIEDLFENIEFGLNSEAELVCPLCGESDKRLLRDVIDPRQLLPLNYRKQHTGDVTERKPKFNSGLDIYFGI